MYAKRAGGAPVRSHWSVGIFHSHSGLVPFSLLPWSLKIFTLKVAVQERAISACVKDYNGRRMGPDLLASYLLIVFQLRFQGKVGCHYCHVSKKKVVP